MLVLFTATIFLNAFLLFLIQPVFARMVLPSLGGSPAVWTTCMLFFQAVLLGGYLYAHQAIRMLGVRRQAVLHVFLVFIPLLVLPLGEVMAFQPERDASPVAWLIGLMAMSVGAPFFVLSTTAPMLQRWFSETPHRAAGDPYFLYAASNAGSLAALLAYPAGIEPFVSLPAQRLWWAAGYAMTATLLAVCAMVTVRVAQRQRPAAVTEHASLARGVRLWWLFVAFVPSGLMLAVTSHISTDIAAVPLLWIVPLALYLVSFIVAFGRNASRFAGPARRLLPLVLLPLVLFVVSGGSADLWFIIPLHLITFFLLSLLCHVELAASRPPLSLMTEFYVWIAVGGMCGGLFNTLVAPALFQSVAEYPILIGAACFALADPAAIVESSRRPAHWARAMAVGLSAVGILIAGWRFEIAPDLLVPLLGIPALLAFGASRTAAPFALCIALLLASRAVAVSRDWQHVQFADRTFFGVYKVVASGDARTLFHGTTIHGRQAPAEAGAPEPLTYYHRDSPVADVLQPLADTSSVGIIGLGVGSVAAYARGGQRWTFYEVDPVVEQIARDARSFTFLRACAERCRVLIGDGRLLIRSGAETHDAIVLDAFSSDAIPVHLMTREALGEYLSHLSDRGVMIFHISNRHFDLEPVLARLAADRQLHAVVRFDRPSPDGPAGREPSKWLAMSRHPGSLANLTADRGWQPVGVSDVDVWTDDFSNIWSVLQWKQEIEHP